MKTSTMLNAVKTIPGVKLESVTKYHTIATVEGHTRKLEIWAIGDNGTKSVGELDCIVEVNGRRYMKIPEALRAFLSVPEVKVDGGSIFFTVEKNRVNVALSVPFKPIQVFTSGDQRFAFYAAILFGAPVGIYEDWKAEQAA